MNGVKFSSMGKMDFTQSWTNSYIKIRHIISGLCPHRVFHPFFIYEMGSPKWKAEGSIMNSFKLHYLLGEGVIEMTSIINFHFSVWGLHNKILQV